MIVEFTNTNPFAIRVSIQCRAPAPQKRRQLTRADFEAEGSRIVMLPNDDGTYRRVPSYQTMGSKSLDAYCANREMTEKLLAEKEETRVALVEHGISWSNPYPAEWLPPGRKAKFELIEGARLIIERDDEAAGGPAREVHDPAAA